jgi:hypothetical protein
MFKKRTRAKDTPSPHSSTAGSDQSWSIEVLHAQRNPESANVPVVRLRAQPNGGLKIVSCTCALFTDTGSCLDLRAASRIIATFPRGSVKPPNGLMIHIEGRAGKGRSAQLASPKPKTPHSDSANRRIRQTSRALAGERLAPVDGRLKKDHTVVSVPSEVSSARFAANLLAKRCTCSNPRQLKAWCKHLVAAHLWMARK